MKNKKFRSKTKPSFLKMKSGILKKKKKITRRQVIIGALVLLVFLSLGMLILSRQDTLKHSQTAFITPVVSCEDSDENQANPQNVGGKVTIVTEDENEYEFFDTCTDDSRVNEYSCNADDSDIEEEEHNCTNGRTCLHGACRVPPTEMNIGSRPASGTNNVVTFCSFNEDGVPINVKQTCYGDWAVGPHTQYERCSTGWILDPADIEEYGCEPPTLLTSTDGFPLYINIGTSYEQGTKSGHNNTVEFCAVVDGDSIRIKAICTGDWQVSPSNGDSSATATCSSGWVYRIAGGEDIEEVDSCSVLDGDCSDTDGGVNYNVRGTVRSTLLGETASDFCWNYGSNYGACEGTDDECVLVELSCDDENMVTGIHKEKYQCPQGCWDGACRTN